jgi:hypothetical protein
MMGNSALYVVAGDLLLNNHRKFKQQTPHFQLQEINRRVFYKLLISPPESSTYLREYTIVGCVMNISGNWSRRVMLFLYVKNFKNICWRLNQINVPANLDL